MAALVQTIPQQNGTVTLLQARPSSASGTTTFASASLTSQTPITRGHSMSLSTYNGTSGSPGYRSSVAPYAFTSTPGLVQSTNSQQRQTPPSQTRPESLYSPAVAPQGPQNGIPQRLQHFAAGSVSSSSSSNSSHRSYVSQDDSVISSRRRMADMAPRPLSTFNLPSPSFTNVSSPTGSGKPSPDRYRRGNRRAENAAGSQTVSVQGHSNNLVPVPVPVSAPSYEGSTQASAAAGTPSIPPPSRPNIQGHVRVPSADDTRPDKLPHPELAKRYRRRSWASLDAAGAFGSKEQLPSNASLFAPLPELNFTTEDRPRPQSAHSRNGSTDSIHSARSSSPSAERDSSQVQPTASKEESKPSTNVSHSPSPLSNQMTMSSESPVSGTTPTTEASAAVQRLTDLNKMAPKKKSRLRRAFSFGSAAELRKVTAQNAIGRREVIDSDFGTPGVGDELDPEQAAIAAQQEANGLGNSIYSNQGHIFTGSTDNLSISSTASSASIMLRKMGKGMKKSTRSLVGLFRPKSIVSTNSEPVLIEPTAPQVSVVNIEAERKTVVANPDPHDQTGGGTVFPKLENTTKDKTRAAGTTERPPVDNGRARKSIIGGEKERAEVLAAVKKGILKHPGNASPVAKPVEISPPPVPHVNDSPHSSAPSTPDDHPHRTGHRRTDTVKIEGEDYFLSVGKFGGSDSKSAPITPQPMVAKSIVFSPRIQFHETWPSGEYDRRGETATCNRLTPLLAQQIKEELNTFKMEMEVHETSKVYTHFL